MVFFIYSFDTYFNFLQLLCMLLHNYLSLYLSRINLYFYIKKAEHLWFSILLVGTLRYHVCQKYNSICLIFYNIIIIYQCFLKYLFNINSKAFFTSFSSVKLIPVFFISLYILSFASLISFNDFPSKSSIFSYSINVPKFSTS